MEMQNFGVISTAIPDLLKNKVIRIEKAMLEFELFEFPAFFPALFCYFLSTA